MNKVTSTVKAGNKESAQGGLTGWKAISNPWTIELRYQGRKMPISYWTGSALGEPTTADVVYCLLTDWVDVVVAFEDWALDLGYDTDSRAAEKIYMECIDQTCRAKTLFGEDVDAFMGAYQEEDPEEALAKMCA